MDVRVHLGQQRWKPDSVLTGFCGIPEDVLERAMKICDKFHRGYLDDRFVVFILGNEKFYV